MRGNTFHCAAREVVDDVDRKTAAPAEARYRPVVVYHVVPGLLAHVPAEVERLSRFAAVHVLFEVSGSWNSNMLDLPPVEWPFGVHDARAQLHDHLPQDVWRLFAGSKGLWYAVYPSLLRPGTLRVASQVVSLLRELNCDLAHLNGESPRSALWMRLARLPYVVNVHEPRVPSTARLPATDLAQRALVPHADVLMVHSRAGAAGLRDRWGNIDSVLAPLGAVDVIKAYRDCQSARPLIDEGENRLRVGLWGWISPRKGADVFLRAAEIAAEELSNVSFAVAGRTCDGFEYPLLPQLPNGCRYEITEGRLSNAQLARFVESCDVVAVPYTDSMQSEVALTAFAFGKPVVGSATGGLTEQVDDGVTGELFEPGSARSMADVLVSMLSDTGMLERMKLEISRKWGQEESWRPFEEGARAAYDRLIG